MASKLNANLIPLSLSMANLSNISINIPEILPGAPGHLIWRIQIYKVIKSDSFHHHPVITSLENHIVFIEDFTPLIKYFLQSFGFYTIPCDMEGVVEITIFVISRNSIGASPHQEKETIRTPGLVELIPNHLKIPLLIPPILQCIHLCPHPCIFGEKSIRVSLDCVP